MPFEAPKAKEISQTSPLIKVKIMKNILRRSRRLSRVPDRRCVVGEASYKTIIFLFHHILIGF